MQYSILTTFVHIDDNIYRFKVVNDCNRSISNEYKEIMKKYNVVFDGKNAFFEKFKDAIAAIDELNAAELLKELKNNS